MTKLFIDDERFPSDDGNWLIARNANEVRAYILAGIKFSFFSFDHDLGFAEETGYDIAKWLIEYDMDWNVLPSKLEWYVHSQNPVGRDAINQYLECAVKNLEKFEK